mmetsp:Transcript_17118/g.32389  ORF Transcript_17118/g.32389 Transcript_17118/m.32389 type:complete len:325 (+) Transcript_17118:176-1150(+)|eukprot:CAMPEP_0176486566 /NCGR_PEP_ID=MMETSP0200_2-20121128/5636_1 /TAXON_ID=947934 /ORGANISM="Chaetoceros sp., Strain GSL56" /LENGTH=324 /DNA_ID=CAMNT_0017883275 /DNA_START=238 /DNA_END=1212 /DNA_ORIENTATION=-
MVSFARALTLSFLLVKGANAFSPLFMKPSLASSVSKVGSRLNMAEGPADGKKIPSGRKEIGFDAASGRFYETGRTAEECVPDDEYCVVDKDSGKLVRLTLKEKERIFLDALQSYYISGRQLLDDEEFDLLKEDLQWNGSSLVQMNRNEAKYLAAVQSYLNGDPIMSDSEFDALKATLKEEGSQFAISTEPKCIIDTGICTVTMKEDSFRNNLLYLPVGSILFLIWLGFGFEVIEPFIRVNPLLLIALGAPAIFTGTKTITDNYIFVDNKVVYGPCPSCEAENRVYFGDILGVEGFKDIAEVKCPNCKTDFTVQRNTLRASTVPK